MLIFSHMASAGATGNLNIPPPRPKRKPFHPYPKNPDLTDICLGFQSAEGLLPAVTVATTPQHSGPLSTDLGACTLPSVGNLSPGGQDVCSAGVRQDSHSAAVAAVVAAALAAALAAATAVVAAAEQHIQDSLQREPPRGFPFFGVPPTMSASPDLQLHTDSQARFRPH